MYLIYDTIIRPKDITKVDIVDGEGKGSGRQETCRTFGAPKWRFMDKTHKRVTDKQIL